MQHGQGRRWEEGGKPSYRCSIRVSDVVFHFTMVIKGPHRGRKKGGKADKSNVNQVRTLVQMQQLEDQVGIKKKLKKKRKSVTAGDAAEDAPAAGDAAQDPSPEAQPPSKKAKVVAAAAPAAAPAASADAIPGTGSCC